MAMAESDNPQSGGWLPNIPAVNVLPVRQNPGREHAIPVKPSANVAVMNAGSA